ncbi:uncharacterized protein LOC112454870 [Temnothorax curvispinosus]|uniref:Uncharacterized protein LOC112454870 n=1 Tax=Temnothorax curvispinosus TaxID=300111 RepID=A0A6J1PR92_9HYME|nr:uncharacterized protein LOC112454870 [Temnothorax curvispinosus]
MINVDLPLNVSRYHFLITMEYFIDQEKYFYLIILHINAAICIGATVWVAIGSMIIACLQHTCGMFRISSYRIKDAININSRQNITLENKILMIEGTICAVDIYRQAIKLNKHLMSKLEIMFFCLIVCFVTSLTLNLYQIVSFENNIEKLILPFLYVSVSILYMFLANLMGQIITDHNNHVFTTA